jgi:two-component system response regulator AtoC
MERLQRYPWPGNVRELENALERALVLGEDATLEPDALPEAIAQAAAAGLKPRPPADGDLSVKRAQRALESDLIRRALERTQGNRSKAAELLELSPRALLYKIRDYGLD